MSHRRRIQVDLSLVLLVLLALVILFILTFELWIPHGPGRHVQ